jgi:hypothetical protein
VTKVSIRWAAICLIGLACACGEGSFVAEESTGLESGADAGVIEPVAESARRRGPPRGRPPGGGVCAGTCVSPERGECDAACATEKSACNARNNGGGPDDLMEPCDLEYQQCLYRCQVHFPY